MGDTLVGMEFFLSCAPASTGSPITPSNPLGGNRFSSPRCHSPQGRHPSASVKDLSCATHGDLIGVRDSENRSARDRRRNDQAILIDLGLLGRPGERRDGSGTRGYLPPEQAVDVALTPAADVFALGVTLFETLTGRRPYGAVPPWSERGIRRLRTLRRATSATTRDSGFSTNRALPDVLAELLDRMLDLEPEQRPGMDSVWHRLDSIARDAEKRRLSR
ncbi:MULTISPECIES: protein kinase domain-containing protein [unclassified Gordonia (in: high G+C Gram-positive bacteria)]|uniref:protein kinase domain-containing protein n=1 Tax=unclassified Gordonia (in: high G+C Gram-positive bacteria) TaxID=2657482 RepID=UPI001112711F|nr:MULTISPECIES: protein kinase [unclassified Gordonia (in: high G+C Gram-positive bacteria)]